jgi:mRNA-degrading endonuclease RelE of RelBE toxin-antitoxin system
VNEHPWQMRVMPRAACQLAELPERYATAVIELLPATAANPRRLGTPLKFELEGRWVARRGPYRIVYAIGEERRTVRVLAVAHRADVYRQR